MLEAVITNRDLAARYGWRPQTERANRIKGQTPPYLKVGNRILYRVADVLAWESDRHFRSTADERVRRESA